MKINIYEQKMHKKLVLENSFSFGEYSIVKDSTEETLFRYFLVILKNREIRSQTVLHAEIVARGLLFTTRG